MTVSPIITRGCNVREVVSVQKYPVAHSRLLESGVFCTRTLTVLVLLALVREIKTQ
jgi:hypothetical protein